MTQQCGRTTPRQLDGNLAPLRGRSLTCDGAHVHVEPETRGVHQNTASRLRQRRLYCPFSSTVPIDAVVMVTP